MVFLIIIIIAIGNVTETNTFDCLFPLRSYEKNEVADISIKEAVEFLSNSNEVYQHCGASYIQHNTFIDNNAKEEVNNGLSV